MNPEYMAEHEEVECGKTINLRRLKHLKAKPKVVTLLIFARAAVTSSVYTSIIDMSRYIETKRQLWFKLVRAYCDQRMSEWKDRDEVLSARFLSLMCLWFSWEDTVRCCAEPASMARSVDIMVETKPQKHDQGFQNGVIHPWWANSTDDETEPPSLPGANLPTQCHLPDPHDGLLDTFIHRRLM